MTTKLYTKLVGVITTAYEKGLEDGKSGTENKSHSLIKQIMDEILFEERQNPNVSPYTYYNMQPVTARLNEEQAKLVKQQYHFHNEEPSMDLYSLDGALWFQIEVINEQDVVDSDNDSILNSGDSITEDPREEKPKRTRKVQ
jgi:hypothetical protein